MIFVLDNYDSFVYNLARYIQELGFNVNICRCDKISVEEIAELKPEAIIISPGPCTPNEAGVSLEVIKKLGPHIPILGVCLGHQAIGQAFGAIVKKALVPMHGKASKITHDGKGLFKGIKNPLTVGRYHSLIVSKENFPAEQLLITSYSEQGEIMSLQHHLYPIFGVQFHPEAILTESGYHLLWNFLSCVYKTDPQESKYNTY